MSTKYVIITDSTCDLSKEKREQNNLEYIKMPLARNGVGDFYCDLEWTDFSPETFYGEMAEGVSYKTSQINAEDYITALLPHLTAGEDILILTCSSALSKCINSALIAKRDLSARFPDRKILIVDTLRGSLAQGLICLAAAALRAEGKTIDEVADWVEENRLTFHQVGSVDDLKYLKNAGRVSATAAFFSKIFKIHPLIISDVCGNNLAVEKVRGRRKSITRCIEYVKNTIIDADKQTILVVNANCRPEAEEISARLLTEVKCKGVEIYPVGPALGASVGPGMFGIYYTGVKVTVGASAE
ncbi:MAG: DegV family protein [Clostridiales bacterium]|jgi:DegV family protein with EDD domain|nr:DegV family protein [Clostridiales bacterium]